MSKKIVAPVAPAPEPISCTAVATFKVAGTDFLTQSVELTIIDGIVVSQRFLCSPDMPASAVGRAASCLWQQYKEQKI